MLLRGVRVVVGAIVLGVTLAACSSSVDDLAKAARMPADDLRVILTGEANRVGASQDDVARQWSSLVTQAHDRYTSVPSEARSVACDVTGDLLKAWLSDDRFTEEAALESAVGAITSLNDTVGAQSLARDLDVEVQKYRAGQPNMLGLVTLSAGVCTAAAA